MTIIARRFTILCLIMSLFAVALTMVVEAGARRTHTSLIELSAPCPEPSSAFCKASL